MHARALAGLLISTLLVLGAAAEDYSPYPTEQFPRELYWGDTHVHTTLSPDANLFGNKLLTPDDAYRFAKGEIITGHNETRVQLRRPLDFLVVTDHAEFLGVLPALIEENPILLATEAGARWAKGLAEDPAIVFGEFGQALLGNIDMIDSKPFEKSIWKQVVANAERHDDPGHFTAFIGYEYTSTTNGDNLHRNVVFRDGADRAGQVVPFSSFDSDNPEDLWSYLAEYEKRTGGSVLAIPHNSNLSGGLMFRLDDTAGNPLTREYAEKRIYFEPIVEATQYKGDSETHPYLSPEDEFANYETWDWANIGVQKAHENEWFPYEYVRSALKLGLGLQADIGANPYRFGLIGSTDAHTALAAGDERDFWGKFSRTEPSPERWKIPMFDASAVPEGLPAGVPVTISEWRMAASGYAAVWATENTREALFDAMRRKETYATTGPRMTVRFFGGFAFDESDAHASDLPARGYEKGVPMGGDLGKGPEGAAPSFLISALKDPDGANLDRVQVVKGWRTDHGKLKEKVYDVALSDGRKPSLFRGKIPEVGDTVDVATATYENSIGDAALTTVWTDPDFEADEHALYYVRVIEIPTPRWTAYDAVRFGIEMPDEVPMTTQERAYTSAIWYTPTQ
jgi:hypothetical protein